MVAGSAVGQDQVHPQPILSAPVPVPNPFQPISHAHMNAPSPATAPSGIRLPAHSSSMANGAGSGMTMSAPQPMPPYGHDSGNNENAKPGDGSADNSPETTTKGGLNNRRQKRLERNRESARLSRRRRKQYLEVLEERVKNLSVEMDKGRRQHVTESVNTLLHMKRHALADPSANLTNVENVSNCPELRVAATFLTQQLSSLSVPPHIKFLLWLSMQNDSFFRGGRASSERLSAARIGERMLSSGNDRVPPAHGMWPLFCNEVGLSYDQEERVRAFQKSLLLSSEGWLQRHSASSSTLLMQSNHDAVQALAHTVGQRQKSVVNDNLTADQKRKFLSWADQNAARIAKASKGTESTAPVDGTDGYKLSEEHHDAANMYILNHRFQNIANSLAKPDLLVNKATLRRFARRPSFESLGSCMAMERKEEEGLSRECSFASTGSLKRSASELSVADEERAQIHCIPPEEAEATVKPAIEAALGFVKQLIPVPPTPPAMISSAVQPGFSMPPPPPKSNQHFVPAPAVSQQHVQCPMPAPVDHNVQPMYSSTMMPPHYSPHQAMSQPAPAPEYQRHQPHHSQQQEQQQQFQGQPVYASQSARYPIMPSFLPPHLNVVPEDGFLPSGNGAEDFLFELAEEDWAIGEGFDDVNLLP
ncbi:bZIP transcription factor [Fragilaria crotonensis]|nr:bZIP transcription factor [Fragilaria crotonensis]